MTESIRLAKHVAERFACSRREAEQYIEGGWVMVDGVVIEEPGHRLAGGEVALHADATLAPQPAVTILLNKPAGLEALADMSALLALLTPAARAADDRSGQRMLRRHLSALTVATPLGKVASGLVVLTEDFRVTRKLVDDAVRIEHEFVVEVRGQIAADGLARLNAGIPLPGRPPGPVKVSWQNEARLRFAAKALKTGHITVMCEAVGLQVHGMRRLRVGRLPLAGLIESQWRYLAADERF
ncbi:MAG: RNA-binding protein [Herminiimonas sp.]|nr:RNA-binding protein [Herminiimonas sp.]